MLYSLTSSDLTLKTVGGKALNLARLAAARFNVPPAYILSTEAYTSFMEKNQLGPTIEARLKEVSTEQPASLEQASTTIRSAFHTGQMPPGVRRSIETAYQQLDGAPLAVRSSATAEDLPDLSFAGQQDTYLNILGVDDLLDAVIGCWSSLWTARAIGYRARNQIAHQDAAVAVVIQEMVPSDVSGVLFTANPLSGKRSESVIDATFGLGEALVSGQVDPDHFVVDHRHREILQRSIGAKQLETRSLPGGGVEARRGEGSASISLEKGQIFDLITVGQQIQDLFGKPQDIEWAFHEGDLYILQSRAITSLYPLPDLSYDPLIVWISFGSVQGLLGPMTPLGQDGIRHVFAGAAHLFNLQVSAREMNVLASAGERLWIRISDFIRNPMGNRLIEYLMRFVEPSVMSILRQLMHEPELGAGKGRVKLSTLRRVLGFFVPVLTRMVRNMRHPESARARFDREMDEFVASIEAPRSDDRFDLLKKSMRLMHEKIEGVFEFVLPRFIPTLGPGMAALTLLTRFAGDHADLALEITRGLPDNVTTQMDMALWEVALEIKESESARGLFETSTAGELATRYLEGKLPGELSGPIDTFLGKYGMRGVGEIDIGRPRWREDPTPVFQTLRSYLSIDPANAPDEVFRRGEQAALSAVDELRQLVRSQPFGRVKALLVGAAARRARALLGARESPKFLAIQTMGIIRKALLESGKMFVQAGTLKEPDDLFYLHIEELEALSENQSRDWIDLIDSRRQDFEREKRRKLVPRVLASDGRAFYEGVGADTDTERALSGSGVSPGTAEGKVHIVLDPHEAHLEPGDILVCPGTDPAWTPLFLVAAGLVTEVGGMMTHGSVVAREYGIPAVVGVHEATTRLSNGQRIRLDGSAGTITLLDETAEGS